MLELALPIAFLASLLAIGIGAASSANGSTLLPVLELCCLFAISLVLTLELVPVLVAVGSRRAAVRRFRRQLDELPETPHPLDQVSR